MQIRTALAHGISALTLVVAVVLPGLGLALGRASAAPGPAKATVAVMPFRDLSGEKPSIGEALRETVTTDLKELSSLRVVERTEIERVLSELKLQAQRTDLDVASAAKVGKLLGATLLVCGAYQQAASQVRLTARFIKVESSEVVGAAKVDGRPSELLRLQDKVTAELLRSAGLVAHVKHVENRPRPELKSLRSVEYYGMALAISDDRQRLPILQAAAAEDAGFAYAVTDLKALEERLKKYQAVYERADAERLVQLEQQVGLLLQSKPQDAGPMLIELLGRLHTARRYYHLVTLARSVLSLPPPSAFPTVNSWEAAGNYLIIACDRLADWDCVLHEGEMILKRFPNASTFSSIKATVDRAIATKRRIEEGKAAAAEEAAKLSDNERWDLCRLARIYDHKLQVKEALRLYRGCVAASERPPAENLEPAIRLAANNGEFQTARELLAELDRQGPAAVAKQVREHNLLPSDMP